MNSLKVWLSLFSYEILIIFSGIPPRRIFSQFKDA
jgi:hypothetical protein